MVGDVAKLMGYDGADDLLIDPLMVVDEETGIDKAGADNYLTGNDISGCGVTSYNNNNCNCNKYRATSTTR